MGNIIKKQGEYIMDQQQTERLVEHILDQMKEMLKRYGFQAVMIRGVCNYQKEELYCIPQYVSGLGFLFEYAHSREEAEKRWHGDGDYIPLKFGKAYILQELEKELLDELKDLEQNS